MKKCNNVSIIGLIIILFFSCSPKENRIKEDDGQKNMKAQYVLNDSLSLGDYSSYRSYIPDEGLIPTAEMAMQIAEIILTEIYGEQEIEEQKPFSVNIEKDIWIIEGHLEKGYLGGVAYIEISKKNGEVLKVIHTK